MTADERTDRLETRVDRLEDQYREDVSAINSKIDLLVAAVNSSVVTSAKTACPSPGSCVTLSVELQNAIRAHNATMLRVERMELRMMTMECWQWRLVGGIGVIMVLLTLFAPTIRQALKLE